MNIIEFFRLRIDEFYRTFGRRPTAIVSMRTVERIGWELVNVPANREIAQAMSFSDDRFNIRKILGVTIEASDAIQTDGSDVVVFYAKGYGEPMFRVYTMELSAPPHFPYPPKIARIFNGLPEPM